MTRQRIARLRAQGVVSAEAGKFCIFETGIVHLVNKSWSRQWVKRHSPLGLTDPNFSFWENVLIKFCWNHSKPAVFRAKSIDLGWIFVKISQNIVNYSQHGGGGDYIAPPPPWMSNIEEDISPIPRDLRQWLRHCSQCNKLFHQPHFVEILYNLCILYWYEVALI